MSKPTLTDLVILIPIAVLALVDIGLIGIIRLLVRKLWPNGS